MIVDGQILGGIAHGIGNALFEWMGYDDDGQPVTTTLADYLLVDRDRDAAHRARAPWSRRRRSTRSASRASARCGVMPTPAAIVSAIEDALAPFGVRIIAQRRSRRRRSWR